MLFRLALLLGKTVHELEAMPATELDEWEVVIERFPLFVPGYWVAGLVSATIANVWGGARMSASDFAPAGKPRIQDPEESWMRFKLIAAGQAARAGVPYGNDRLP
jgi:hypothetical protein